MLEINNYSSKILSDISFSLEKNEDLLILGENGAGKSTLAKVLCNLITNNSVKIDGKSFDELEEEERASLINYIPPKLSIFDEYVTLREFLELSSISKINHKKVDEIISMLKLNKLENRSCKAFSSGEKQLLLLASSLMHNAKITIFDELTANLDISRIKEVYDVFKSDKLEQKIVITHNLDLAYALGFKVLFIKNGRIEFFGTNDDFFTNKNLKKFYNDSIMKVNNHLVVNL